LVREISYDPVHDAQAHFRHIMDALARPGKINSFPAIDINPPAALYPASSLIGFSLLNRDVSFHCINLPAQAHEYIHANTDSDQAELSGADFIFLNGGERANADLIQYAKTGDIRYPEQSATLIIQVSKLAYENFVGAQKLTLYGPGIQYSSIVYLDAIHPELLSMLTILNDSYPLGVDAFVTDTQGNFIGLPRTTQIQTG